MFISSKNKISQYYLSNHDIHPLSSSRTCKVTTVKNPCKQTDSLSSLSETSLTIILHAVDNEKKCSKKKHSSRFTKDSSNKLKGIGLNTNRSSSQFDKKSHRTFQDKTTSFPSHNSLSNRISDLKNLDLTDENYSPSNSSSFLVGTRTVCTQTDKYSSIHEQYQYGNLRKVNSDLLDYIFISNSNE